MRRCPAVLKCGARWEYPAAEDSDPDDDGPIDDWARTFYPAEVAR